MASFYRVLQYIPDLVRDERINVGIVVYDDVTVVTEGLRDWSRVEAFCGHPADFSDHLRDMNAWSPETAKTYRSHYMSSLQLTEPRASTLPLFSLVERIAARFLVEPAAVVS